MSKDASQVVCRCQCCVWAGLCRVHLGLDSVFSQTGEIAARYMQAGRHARTHARRQAGTRIPMHTCPHRCRRACDFQTLTASRYADESGAVKQAARGAAIAEPGRGGRGRQGRQNFESAGSRHGAQGRAGGGKGRRTYAAPRRAGGKRHRGQEHQATGGASSAADERSGHGPRSQRGARGGDASADLEGQGAGRAAR